MIDQHYLSVLSKIYAQLNVSDVNWVLTGSASFALQGVPTRVHDIDIQTDEVGAHKIERLFSEFIVRKVNLSSTEAIRSHFGILMIDGVRVEIMGDIRKRSENGEWEQPVDLQRHKQFVDVEDMHIPVLSLEYEYQAYLKMGREEKAELLRQWITRQ